MTRSGQESKPSKQKNPTVCHPVSKPFYPFHNYVSPFQQVTLYFNKSLYTVQSKLQSFDPTA